MVPLIIKRVQWELRDFGATWTDADFICQVLAIKNDDLEQELESLDLNFDTQVVILPAVAANTTDLSSFQVIGGPLACMTMPITIEWRLSGENQQDWEVVDPVAKVLDTDTGTGLPGAAVASDAMDVESWEWRDGIIFISPSQSVVDLRVRFQALPANLDADSPNQPIRGVVNILVYWICWSIAKSRGGAASAEAVSWKEELGRSKANFENNQIKPKHGQRQRLGGRRSGMRQGPNSFRIPTG